MTGIEKIHRVNFGCFIIQGNRKFRNCRIKVERDVEGFGIHGIFRYELLYMYQIHLYKAISRDSR